MGTGPDADTDLPLSQPAPLPAPDCTPTNSQTPSMASGRNSSPLHTTPQPGALQWLRSAQGHKCNELSESRSVRTLTGRDPDLSPPTPPHGALAECGVRAHVPPISAATPVWSRPGESGKPDSKLPIFSLQLRVGCLFYIFISTTERLAQPARTGKGWAVLMLSVPLPCCAVVLESKTPQCSN